MYAMRVSRPAPNVLEVSRRQLFSALGGIVAGALFFAGWYYVLLDLRNVPAEIGLVEHVRNQVAEDPFLWLFILPPLLGVPSLFKAIKVRVIGETLTFDGISQIVSKNRKPLAMFADIEGDVPVAVEI